MKLLDLWKKYRSVCITRIFLIWCGFYPAESSLEKICTSLGRVYSIMMIMIAIYVEGAETYFCCVDFDDVVRIAVNILSIVISVFKIIIMTLKKSQLYELIIFTREKFWYQDHDEIYTKHMRDAEARSYFLISGYAFLHQIGIGSFVWANCLENVGKNETDRLLPFPMHLPVPLPVSKTPLYEILFALEMVTLYQIAVIYVCFDYTLCVVNVQVIAQLKILQEKLNLLFEVYTCGINEQNEEINAEKCYLELQKCIRHHQGIAKYVKYIDSLYTVYVLGQVTLLGLHMCLIGYHIVIVRVAFALRVPFACYYIITLFQLFLFTETCDGIIRESSNVNEILFHASWYKIHAKNYKFKIRKTIRMIMMRARKPFHLSAAGFFNVSLESLNAVLSTSLSYFMLLRQQRMKEEFDNYMKELNIL